MSNNKWFDSIKALFSSKEVEGNADPKAHKAKGVCKACEAGYCHLHMQFGKPEAKDEFAKVPVIQNLAAQQAKLDAVVDATQQALSKETAKRDRMERFKSRLDKEQRAIEDKLTSIVEKERDLAQRKDEVQRLVVEVRDTGKAANQLATADIGSLLARKRQEMAAKPVSSTNSSTPTAPTAPGNGATRREPSKEQGESKYGPTKWDTEMVPKLEAIGIAKSRIDTLGQKAKEGDLKKCLDWAQAIKNQGGKNGVDNPAQLRKILAILVGQDSKNGYRAPLWARVTLSLEGVDSSTMDNNQVCVIARELLGITAPVAGQANQGKAPAEPSGTPADDVEDPNYGDPDTVGTAPKDKNGVPVKGAFRSIEGVEADVR